MIPITENGRKQFWEPGLVMIYLSFKVSIENCVKLNQETPPPPSPPAWTINGLFQRQRWGNFREMGRSAYGLFRAHGYHLATELN